MLNRVDTAVSVSQRPLHPQNKTTGYVPTKANNVGGTGEEEKKKKKKEIGRFFLRWARHANKKEWMAGGVGGDEREVRYQKSSWLAGESMSEVSAYD